MNSDGTGVTAANLRDAIVYCPRCGAETFYDADALRARGRPAGRLDPSVPRPHPPGSCWSCGADVPLPARIRIGRHVVVLNHDSQLFPHHLDDQRLYDFSRPVAAVGRHPVDPTIWGLRNLSDERWAITGADGTKDVPPGRAVTLAAGTRIHFGRVEGEVRV
jgi:hypothetical protein